VNRPLANATLAFALVPDALSLAFFLIVWSHPFAFGALSVKTAMLTMLLEFFLVHATGFFTVFANDQRGSKWKRIGAMAGLSLFYFTMIGAFALSFQAWWPLLAFAWLLAGKVAWVWTSRPDADDPDGSDATFRQMAAWAGSVVLFLGGVVLTSVQDVPRWGMTADVQPRFGLDMASSGLWESQPHRVVAFGALYFGAMLFAKWVLAMWDRRRAMRAGNVG
jgi:hypothetical protein